MQKKKKRKKSFDNCSTPIIVTTIESFNTLEYFSAPH